MRTMLVLAGLLAAGAVPVTAAAQHEAAPAPAAHAATTPKPASPAVKGEAATTHAPTPARPPEKPVEKTAAKPAEKLAEKAPAATHETAATHDTKPASSTKAGAAPAESAPGASHEARAVAEVKPAAKVEKPGKPGEKAPEKASEKASDKAATARKGAPFSDLEAAFDRIAQKIQGAEVMPGGLRISPGSPVAPARAAESRPAEARAARGEATPRIHLIWRSAVVWPASLGPAETHESEPAHETSRITLAWP